MFHFQGDLMTSPVTGRLEPFYPSWIRNLFRYFISLPVIGVCLSVVFYFQGDLMTSPVTGRLESFYPSWKHNLFRYFISLPVIGVCLSVVFYFQGDLMTNPVTEDWNPFIPRGNVIYLGTSSAYQSLGGVYLWSSIFRVI